MDMHLSTSSSSTALKRRYIERTAEVLNRLCGRDATDVIMYYIKKKPLRNEREFWNRLNRLLGSSAYIIERIVRMLTD